MCFRCRRSECWQQRDRTGARNCVCPPPAAGCHQTSQNSCSQMPRVRCHILPSADLLLSLQRVCVVRNKLRRTIIIFNIILHISSVFIHHRGLNKQGYQCRGEYYFPCIKVWMSPLLFISAAIFVSFRMQRSHSQKMHWQSHRQMHWISHQQQGNNGRYLHHNFFFQLNKFWSCWYSIFKSFVNLWLSFLQIK